MEPKEKRAFEPTGLVPRSIVRTFERFRQQLLPGSERAAIREYRISRYQVLVSARCLLILLTIPIATNWFVSSWLLSPLIEHFWNTQQNEVFLNSYQEERAFAELEFFSDKLFFESLLSNDNDVPKEQNDYRLSKTKNPQEHFLPVFVTSFKSPSISSIWCLAKKITSAQSPDSFLEKEKRANVVRGTEADKNTVAASLIVDLNLRPNMETDHGTATLSSLGSHSSDFSEKGLLERKKKFSMPIYDDFLFTENTDYIKKSSEIFDCTDKMDFSDKIKATEQLKNTNIFKKDKEFSFSSYPTFANSMRSVLYATQQKSKEQLMAVACCPCFYRTAVPTVCSGAKKHFLPQVVPGKKHAPLACSLVAKHESERTASPRTACFFPGTTLPSTGTNEQAKKRTLNINNTENSLKIKEKIQEKILELAVYYNQQTILSITNIAGDFISLFTLACLFIWMKPEISILKSFLIEAIYSLSDTTKSFLLILLTDLLVGFHSPRGWETALELLLKHLGLPENQDFVFLFVATFPVLLDTVFKYWIFRHLNKISPSTVATYHSMIE